MEQMKGEPERSNSKAIGVFQAGLPQEAGEESRLLSHCSGPSLLHTQSSGHVL